MEPQTPPQQTQPPKPDHLWARNLLFLGLWVVGLLALAVNLFQGEPPDAVQAAVAEAARQTTVHETAARIDGAFRSAWSEAGLEPAPPADDLLVARRLSLALAGTVPSLQEIRDLQGLDTDSRVDREGAVDRAAVHLEHLLTDRRTSEYQAERLARAAVGVENGPFLLYRRRRLVLWLADQLHENRAYDEIVRELIAGTGLWTDNPATNFITVSLIQDQGGQPDENKLAGRVCRAFLGVRLDCAQCHDHPFNDEWKQTDFQGLAAWFGPAQVSLTGVSDAGGPHKVEDLELSAALVPLMPTHQIDDDRPLLRPEEATRRHVDQIFKQHDTDGNRQFSGEEFAATVEATVGQSDEVPDEAALSELFARLDWDASGQLSAEELGDGLAGRRPFDPAVPFHEQLLREEESPRATLARWVTHRKNPLFARAAVNRMWNLMFGLPLVEPVDDIPTDGPYPPALEILAEDFTAHGYDLRRLARVIAATEVFRLDSRADHGLTDDHHEAWAAFPLTRLRPEQVVGGLLQSAWLDTLDHQSHILQQLARATGENDFVRRYGDEGDNELEPAGGTIPQRLLLLNGNLVRDKTEGNLVGHAPARIAALAPTDSKAVETAYLAVLSRFPSAAEADHFAERLRGSRGDARHRKMADLYWVLLNSTEFSWNH